MMEEVLMNSPIHDKGRVLWQPFSSFFFLSFFWLWGVWISRNSRIFGGLKKSMEVWEEVRLMHLYGRLFISLFISFSLA